MKNKIGVGVVTYKRPEFFKNCIATIPGVDTLVVVNDGTPYDNSLYPSTVKEVIQHSTNKSVGVAKNAALRYLVQDRCDHLFLIEDDMLITNPNVFVEYIKSAEKSGIWHLNYAYHGPANVDAMKRPNPKMTIQYDDDRVMSFNQHCVGAFSYYLKTIIKHIGYMDERFKNSWDHVEHTYRIIKTGLHPPFWWFADLANSNTMISEQACSTTSTTIERTPEWNENMVMGMNWFKTKHGHIPVQVPHTPQDQTVQVLQTIQRNYARNVL